MTMEALINMCVVGMLTLVATSGGAAAKVPLPPRRDLRNSMSHCRQCLRQ